MKRKFGIEKIGILTIATLLIAAMAVAPASAQELEIRGEAFDFGNNQPGQADFNASLNTTSWTASNFPAFYYDLDTGQSFETLNITNASDEKLSDTPSELVYTVTVGDVSIDYEYGNTTDDSVIENVSHTVSGLSLFGELFTVVGGDAGELSKVLVDRKDDITVATGDSIPLEEGYSLEIQQVDVDGDKVLVDVVKDGETLSSEVVTAPGDLTYEVELFDEDVSIIEARVDQVFRGETSLATFDGVFQLSEDTTTVDADSEFGELDDVSIDGMTDITMKNGDELTIGKDKKTKIYGGWYFRANDYSDWTDVIFYPVEVKTEAGTYEVRGAAYEATGSRNLMWNAFNFPAFYYDLDSGNEFESLTISGTLQPAKIGEGNLSYVSRVGNLSIDYEYGNTTDDSVIESVGHTVPGVALFGELFTVVGGDAGELSKILVDRKDDITVATGDSIELEDGYSLEIQQVDVDGDKVLVDVVKDGETLSSEVVDAGGDLTYEVELFDEDVSIIETRVDQVFRGETSLATFDGVFQLSEDTKTVDTDSEFGELDEVTVNTDSLEMSNGDELTIGKDKTTGIHGDWYFRANDFTELNTNAIFYPAVERTIGGVAPTPEEEETETPEAPEVDLEAGQATYESKCVGCHGADGTGNLPGQPDFTNADFWPAETQQELLEALENGVGAMPAQGLSEEDAINVLAYEADLAGVAWSDIPAEGATPTPEEEETATATPTLEETETATPAPPEETETPTPGFTALFAVAGLLAVAYALRREH